MRILVYHGRGGDEYYLAENKRAAFRTLFNHLDAMGYYDQETGLEKAREGSHRAIQAVLESRQCCEYENWDLEEIVIPLDNG